MLALRTRQSTTKLLLSWTTDLLTKMIRKYGKGQENIPNRGKGTTVWSLYVLANLCRREMDGTGPRTKVHSGQEKAATRQAYER